MIIIPNQFAGLGDICFTQTLVRKIANGNPVLWPCLGHFVDGLNRAFGSETMKFVDWKKVPINYESREHYEMNVVGIGEATILPIRWSSEILNRPYDDAMKSKYILYGFNWQDWREHAIWRRSNSEMDLVNAKMKVWDKYEGHILVNRTFGSDCKLTVPIPRFKNEIEMQPIYGFSLFDWAYLLETADEIHTVNTSIIYLLEMIDLKAKEVHLYQRSIPGQTFSNIEYLLKKHKYIFHA